jgi:hypothetical protein
VTIVYVREDGVLGVMLNEYPAGATVRWFIDGLSVTSFLEEDEYVILREEDLNE